MLCYNYAHIIVFSKWSCVKPFYKRHQFKFDNLQSLEEVSNKFFYLSGNFIDKNKKKFAEEIENLGGRCQDLTKRPVVNPKEIDYLVIGGNGYNNPTHGSNYKKVAKWNEQNPSKKIPIIHQLHCEELLTEFTSKFRPK